MSKQFGFLCITCEFKGDDFLRQLAEMGHRVYLITSEAHQNDPWPFELITETFYMPGSDGRAWNMDNLKLGVAHLMRRAKIDRVIALDDYDVQKAAFLREEYRMPGMGQTTARHFYDKLAMRIQARDAGIPVPGFSDLFNDADITHFLNNSEGPWFVKPRSDAGAVGIKKAETQEAFWQIVESLGDNRHRYLVEEYKHGAVCHVDSLSYKDEITFTRSSQYLNPPFDIAHGGGIFQSCTLSSEDHLHFQLVEINRKVMQAFGMKHGASHSEYIMHNEEPVFLETSARVGGANLSNMVEIASGVNLWREWAKIELAVLSGTDYVLPESHHDHAGIIASLSRHEYPDYGVFGDAEIAWNMHKPYHIGFIFKSPEQSIVLEKLGIFSKIIAEQYHASLPAKD